MAGNTKKKRKAGRRAPVVHFTSAGTLPILFRTRPDEERNLKLIPHQELDILRRGMGTEETWNVLTTRTNWGTVLARSHDWSEDPRPQMEAGLTALVSMKERCAASGRYVATGDELRAIGQAIALTDDMQDGTTRRQHRDALREVLKAMQQ